MDSTFCKVHGRQWQGWMLAIMFGALLATAGQAANFNHDVDFDGDGIMDPAVYNESSGEWNVLLSPDFNLLWIWWGGPGWSAIQSDYDGDGRADVVAYNRSNGDWNMLLSGNGYSFMQRNLGGQGWDVVTGDYDGDGKTDPTVYCPETGNWMSMFSGLNYTKLSGHFGGPGYEAVPGDYDGDGLSDPAIYCKSSGEWLIQSSLFGMTASVYVDTMGDDMLTPVPADYDGDRKTDPAVFAYRCGASIQKEHVFGFYVLHSSKNYKETVFRHLGHKDGPSTAEPLPFDYDNDGLLDYAVSWPDDTAELGWRTWFSRHDFHPDMHTEGDWRGTGFYPVQR